jgi:hypothetical protein
MLGSGELSVASFPERCLWGGCACGGRGFSGPLMHGLHGRLRISDRGVEGTDGMGTCG